MTYNFVADLFCDIGMFVVSLFNCYKSIYFLFTAEAQSTDYEDENRIPDIPHTGNILVT